MRRVFGSAALSALIVAVLYLLLWRRRMGDWVVRFLQVVPNMSYDDAYIFYDRYFRGNKDLFFFMAILLVFVLLLWNIFRRVTQYFNEINEGVGTLLDSVYMSLTDVI